MFATQILYRHFNENVRFQQSNEQIYRSNIEENHVASSYLDKKNQEYLYGCEKMGFQTHGLKKVYYQFFQQQPLGLMVMNLFNHTLMPIFQSHLYYLSQMIIYQEQIVKS